MSLAKIPRFSPGAAAVIALDLFGIKGIATALPSERDQNFKFTAQADGRRYVLKIANVSERRAMLDAENAAMAHLAASGCVPEVMRTVDGGTIGEAGGHLVRLISFLDGAPLGARTHHSAQLLAELGALLGTVDSTLASFDHPAVHRDFHWDLAHAEREITAHIGKVRDPELRACIDAQLAIYCAQTKPLLPALRKSVIHNDANDFNVVALLNRVSDKTDPADQAVAARGLGLVDFGDMLHTHTINELAICAAYAALGKSDPVAAIRDVTRGYHSTHALRDEEMAVLFNLICMRLCVSVCVAAKQQAERPDDAYLGISQGPIKQTLPKLTKVHARLGQYLIRDACGRAPVPHTARIVDWLQRHAASFASIVDVDLRDPATKIEVFDLSVGSLQLHGDPDENAAAPLTYRLFDTMRRSGAVIGVNGYDEARVFYTSPAFMGERPLDETRTIHVAIDLTLPAGAPVYAPLDGVVHGFENATDRLDYGPVIVLKHDADGVPFYTLYGHLALESLDGLQIGKPIAKGQRVGWLGAAPINGDWWPHVHFQVITDMLDIACNFNGSALASQRAVWKSISPDPNLILGIPPAKLWQRRDKANIAASRAAHIGGNLSVSYSANPLNIVRGWKQYLYDETGRRYIDAYNNVPHVGHSHPRVVRAVAEQLGVLNTNTRYLQQQLADYSEALLAQLPPELSVCYLVTSGSEANDLALRLARTATGARDLIVMDTAYHGHSSTLIDISPYKHNGPGGTGAPDWVHTSPVPDVYRGDFKADDPVAGAKYAAQVGTVVDAISAQRRTLCGYIAETCPSVGGQILLPAGFLADVYARVRAAGGLCIADEVQTGFGRIGTHFWAFQAHGVVPDIVVLGKPIGNGYPLAAVICRPEIAAAFNNGMEFFSTFGGSTAACAAGLATLQVTLDENLQAHAATVGAQLLSGLRELQTRHAMIGDVRGSGLFAGIELVRDRATREPAADAATYLANRMRERCILLGTDGPHHNVIKLRGPMPLSSADAALIVEALDESLMEIGMRDDV
jgi:4-aminobutyrate aminotransferase-like enzyme/Ser/Thr protein kinase RdoA (MazF antagonist)